MCCRPLRLRGCGSRYFRSAICRSTIRTSIPKHRRPPGQPFETGCAGPMRCFLLPRNTTVLCPPLSRTHWRSIEAVRKKRLGKQAGSRYGRFARPAGWICCSAPSPPGAGQRQCRRASPARGLSQRCGQACRRGRRLLERGNEGLSGQLSDCLRKLDRKTGLIAAATPAIIHLQRPLWTRGALRLTLGSSTESFGTGSVSEGGLASAGRPAATQRPW